MQFLPLVAPGPILSSDEIERYARQIAIPEFGELGQRRLGAARVLVVGAGGLGSPVLLYLAAAGVGTLGIIDFDLVEESNLQRQVLYSQSNIGKGKADCAKARIAEINSNVRVQLHPVRLTSANSLAIFAEYDVIIDGTDNFATRYLINDSCVILGKPAIWGSIFRFDGQTSIFWAKHGPCYRCFHPEPPPFGSVPNCQEAGVLGILCASIGSIQATEAIKLITGMGEPLIGAVMIYDGLKMEYEKIPINKDPLCVICGASPSQVKLLENYEEFCGSKSGMGENMKIAGAITVSDLERMISEGDKFLLVDVREPREWESGRIEGAVLIPQGEIFDGSAIAGLPKEIPIVLYCRSGVRSADCLEELRGAGFPDAMHLEGGILAWQESAH